MKILIIEDEYNLADAISCRLKKEKYCVDIDGDGEKGLNDALTNLYDLIILDVMLPKINGFEILKELKENKINSKILMLTAKYKIEDKLTGFKYGADEYLTKPFYMDELVARVNIQLRKEVTLNNDMLELGDIRLCISKLKISCTNTEYSVDIVGKEFQLLEYFMKNPNKLIDRELLYSKIWGLDCESESNNLEAYISFVRKKIKLIGSKLQIKAIRGMGYKLEVNDEKIKE